MSVNVYMSKEDFYEEREKKGHAQVACEMFRDLEGRTAAGCCTDTDVQISTMRINLILQGLDPYAERQKIQRE